MANRLQNILVLGTIFVSFSFGQAQVNEAPKNPMNCIAHGNFTIEFNSITYGNSEYTRQNVVKLCFLANFRRTVEGVKSLLECSSVAFNEGMNSFSFEDGVCEISSFYAAPNSTDILRRFPTGSTKVVFIAWPPVNEENLIDQDPGMPSMEDVYYDLLTESPLMMDVTLKLKQRMCLIKSLKWIVHRKVNGPPDISQQLMEWEIGSREVEFQNANEEYNICEFAKIFVNLEYVTADGMVENERAYFRDIPSDYGFQISYDWVNVDRATPAGVDGVVNVDIHNVVLTRIELKFYADRNAVPHLIGNETNVQGEQNVSFPFTITMREAFYEGIIYGSFYGLYDCLIAETYLVNRSVCVHNDNQTWSENGNDRLNMCVMTKTNGEDGLNFDEAQSYCQEAYLYDSYLVQPSVVVVQNEAAANFSYEMLLQLDDVSHAYWLNYRVINGTWQWPDGTTELNEEYLDTSRFFPIQPVDNYGACSFLKRRPNDSHLYIKQKCCNRRPRKAALCVAVLSGDIKDSLYHHVVSSQYGDVFNMSFTRI